MQIREAYVAALRYTRRRADSAGVLERLERADTSGARHLRSMFAIHDVADMAYLDLAWWTYEALRKVEALLVARGGQGRVFEYGAGASTVWLGRRAREVHSVEHDAGFASFLDPLLDPFPHVSLRLVQAVESAAPTTPSRRRGHGGLDFTEYVAAIDDVPGQFDLVVVDGSARVASARRSLPRLAPGGVLLLDNANRREYGTLLHDPALDVHITRGATPCLPYPTVTALVRPR